LVDRPFGSVNCEGLIEIPVTEPEMFKSFIKAELKGLAEEPKSVEFDEKGIISRETTISGAAIAVQQKKQFLIH
jgi:hypothetical protein